MKLLKAKNLVLIKEKQFNIENTNLWDFIKVSNIKAYKKKVYILLKEGKIVELYGNTMKDKVLLTVNNEITEDFEIIKNYIFVSKGWKNPMIKRFNMKGKLEKKWIVCPKQKKRILRQAFFLFKDRKDYLYAVTPKYIVKYNLNGKEIKRMFIGDSCSGIDKFSIEGTGIIDEYNEKGKILYRYDNDGKDKDKVNLRKILSGDLIYYKVVENKMYYLSFIEGIKKTIVGEIDLKTRKHKILLSFSMFESPYMFEINPINNSFYLLGIEKKVKTEEIKKQQINYIRWYKLK